VSDTLPHLDPSRIRIVMIETSHPGNIGSAARAMKTMGLQKLILVSPKSFPDPEGRDYAMASGAVDLLNRAQRVDSLDEALRNVGYVLGATARLRATAMPMFDARRAAKAAIEQCAHTEVAILFGREHSGLTNEEMNRCHALLHIPANPDYSSLNIAAAIQIVAYECRMVALADNLTGFNGQFPKQPAPVEQLEGYLDQLRKALEKAEFLNPQNPQQLMKKIRALYLRAQPTPNEINILRGVLTALTRERSRMQTGEH